MEKILRLSPAGDPRTGLSRIGYSFPDAVCGGDPVESAHVFHDALFDSATIGIWESGPGSVDFDAYPFDELCVIVEGEVALVGRDGSIESFRAGDAFLIFEGWSGMWTMHRALRKFYVELKRQ